MNGELRKRAEAFLQANPEETPAFSTAEVQQMIHELDVHQIELQMQNDELTSTLQELEESRDAFAELYDAAPVGYLTCDRDGGITRANQTLAGMLGVGRGALLGRRISDFIVPGSQDEWYRHRRALLAGAERLGTDLELQPAEGPSIQVRFDCRVAPGATVDEWRCRSALIDITARKHAEDELARLNHELERRVEQRTAELHKSEQQVIQDCKELRQLSAELPLVAERERQRVAETLHEDMGQMLSSAQIRLKMLRNDGLPPESGQHVEAVINTIEQVLKQTRKLTFELNCPLLGELGLGPALGELCQTMMPADGVRLEYKGGSEEMPLSFDRKITLFRAARELLTNVLKHADARRATVELCREDDGICVRVEDDGCGFDAAGAGRGFTASGGFGLFSLQENIRHAGGLLKIESMPKQGTRASISLPLEEAP